MRRILQVVVLATVIGLSLVAIASAAGSPSTATGAATKVSDTTAVLNGTSSVDLPPASAYIRRLQHEMARKANLISHSYGKEPRRRVRIFRD